MIRAIMSDLLANPGRALLAALLLLCLIMVVPVVAALRRKAKEREREKDRAARRRPPPRSSEPREPRFGPAPYLDDDDDDDDDEEEDGRYRRSGFGSGPPRRGRPVPVGALAKFAWFGLGVAVGVGVMAVNSSTFTISNLLRMPVAAGPEETAASAPPPAPVRQQAAPAAAPKEDGRAPEAVDPVKAAEEALAKLPPNAPRDNGTQAAAKPVDAQVAEFVSGMRARLPMPIGRDINLVEVNAKDRVVTLAFAIQIAIPESDYPALQKTLDERFRAGICTGNDELRIRALNEAGVSFSVHYADLIGKTVARLEMLPDFCKAAG